MSRRCGGDDDDPWLAAVLLGAADSIWPSVGIPLLGSRYLDGPHEECVRRTRQALTEREFVAAFEYGAGLSLDMAVECAAPVVTSAAVSAKAPAKAPVTAPAPWPPLSRRECQVAALVADGLCDREIAQRLMIAKRTADAHVEHIPAKLTVSSRTQVATWVTQQRSRPAAGEQPGLGRAGGQQPGLGAAQAGCAVRERCCRHRA
ncbi:MAG TPA: helix-turn-helix transcriptional regulator [Streptosporangiaceae bacterium]|nr:helix-turn-helix transcriptional regulator [Streptosporangiaceae bacterium]